MDSKMTENEWLRDFNEFVKVEGEAVPETLSQKILMRVQRDLNPSPWIVFFKFLGIHSVVGTLSLGICNQFGVNPFHTDFSLSHYFMKLGYSTCMVLCGILFVSLSVAMAAIIFRQEEFSVLQKNSLLQIFSLSSFSLVMFLSLGAEVTLGIGVLWLLGAMFGGIISTILLNKQKNLTPLFMSKS